VSKLYGSIYLKEDRILLEYNDNQDRFNSIQKKNLAGNIMSQATVSQFVTAVKEDPSLIAELNAAIDVESYYKIAQDHGYFFTSEELQAELSQESQEELAGMINPGTAPRKHLAAQ
jgi:predicted ribosomally synthesized peptide with nif11-like leader